MLRLGPLVSYVVTGSVYQQNTETVSEFFIVVCTMVMPSFGFARGLLVYTSNYWKKRRCTNPTQAVNCAVGGVHPCCPGERHFVRYIMFLFFYPCESNPSLDYSDP